MKFRIFSIPVFASETAQAELNLFLDEHVVLRVERQFVADGENSFWTICVCYRDRAEGVIRPVGGTTSFKRKSGKVDYREKLPDPDFLIFSRIRALRRNMALEEGVPPYALFNDEQLAEMATKRLTTPEQVSAIPGVGASRTKKYADVFLKVLAEEYAKYPSSKPPDTPPPTPAEPHAPPTPLTNPRDAKG